jgi:hypothetical protein
MKKTFIYSFCGLFITSVAVARTLYMDVGADSQCGGFCLVNPGNGACCPTGSVVTKLNSQSSDSSTKTVEGFYLGGVKLADYDGALRTLSADEIATIRASAGTELSTGTAAQLTKQEYNKNTTQYVVFGENGEFTEYDNPQKSGTFCDHARIILYKNDGTNASQTVYYKYGVGYFTDPARTTPFNPASAKITRNGYTLRGWFTSTWDSSTTDKSSYIANYTPYRTIGHAFIPWTNTVTAPVSSSDTLSWPGNNKAFSVTSCPDDKGTASSYPIVMLYAGWAKNCEHTEYCELYISGQTPVTTLHNGYVRNTAGGARSWKLNDKSTIYGDWLPGGVDYAWKNQGVCPSGTQYTAESTTTISLSYPYPTTTNPVTQTLNTNKLGCESTTPTQPTKIKLTYHGSAATSFDYCDIGGSNTITIKNAISSQQIEAVAYTQGGTPVFNAGQTVSCSVGNGGFATYTTDGEYYVVNLYPVAAPALTCPTASALQPGAPANITVTADTHTTTQCKYTLTCPTNYTLNGLNSNGQITCTGSNCASVINGYSCVAPAPALTCPTASALQSGAPDGITVTEGEHTTTQCKYTLKCRTNYTLNGPNSNGQITCTGSNCASVINGYSCTAPAPTFTCPAVPNVANGTVRKTDGNDSCVYTLTCNTGYAAPDTSMNTTYNCTGNNCTSASVNNWANGLECRKQITCPNPNTIENGNIGKQSINNGTACKYTINCNAPAYVCDANVDHCTNGFTCESVEACNAWLSTTRSSTCVFQCPSKSYLESKLPHMNVQGLTTANPLHDCQYTLGTCTYCYQRAHSGDDVLYCDGAECNGSNWYSTADSCTWVGGDGCAAQ